MCVLVNVTEQLSVADGGVQVTIPPHDELAEMDMSDGHPVMTGLLLSVTVTLNAHIAVFPPASVAVYFTCVVPSANVLPGVWVLVIVTEQLSIGCGGVQLTTAPHEEFAETTMFEGQPVITGVLLSVTVTLNVHVETFPAPSVAVYFTCVVPTAKELPEVCVLVNVTEQLSVA
jgi:hypothetical protein